jgi:hypothetical protein
MTGTSWRLCAGEVAVRARAKANTDRKAHLMGNLIDRQNRRHVRLPAIAVAVERLPAAWQIDRDVGRGAHHPRASVGIALALEQ